MGLGIVILPHGAQKLLGWFGGGGVSGTIGFFESAWGIPAVLTALVIAAEFFGALVLVFGFGIRIRGPIRGAQHSRRHGRCGGTPARRGWVLHELEWRTGW
jgi:hypothetical protein